MTFRFAIDTMVNSMEIPVPLQLLLLKDRHWAYYHLVNLCRNPSVSKDIQLKIVGESLIIRAYMAENPGICLEAQKILAEDESFEVRSSLRKNPNISSDIKKIIKL